MIVIQNKIEDSPSYKAGYEIGQFIGHNPIISLLIGVLFVAVLIYFAIKIFKKLRNFGE
jgi:hypothetical protein